MSRCVTATFALTLVGFAALASAPACADSGPVIVIPSRLGVPVVINGIDASYAVVEGDWGLARPGHGTITVIGGSPLYPNHVYHQRNFYYPAHGRPPALGRNEIEPAADRALPDSAESYSRSWSTSSDITPATITDSQSFPQNFDSVADPQSATAEPQGASGGPLRSDASATGPAHRCGPRCNGRRAEQFWLKPDRRLSPDRRPYRPRS